jgi:hypothetical protein
MMSEHVKNMIDALDQDDNLEAETNLKAALTDKVGAALDDRRKDLAKTFVRSDEVGEAENVDSVQSPEQSDTGA